MECLVRISIICVSIVQKGRFRDFTIAKREEASPQVIALNQQREAVLSCDYKSKKYRTFSVARDTKTCRHSVCQRPLKNCLMQVSLRRFVQMLVLLLKKKLNVIVLQDSCLSGRCTTPSAIHLRLSGASSCLINFVLLELHKFSYRMCS